MRAINEPPHIIHCILQPAENPSRFTHRAYRCCRIQTGRFGSGLSDRPNKLAQFGRSLISGARQVDREKEGSQVINNIHVVDLSLSYAVSKRISATLSVPFQFATRSQTVRDTRPGMTNQFGNQRVFDRFTTEANGLSDIKLLGTVWLLDPEHNKKQNVSVGLGVLFPTGEKDAKDTLKVFGTNAAGLYELRAVTQNVDNWIQPGAGAWGIIFDLYAFKEV